MAENVDITPGTGKTIGTDEVTINAVAVQVQRVKLVESFEGSGAELSKREDDPHVSGDPGFMLLAVRKDAATGLSSADGDYHPLEVDASGRLWVNVGASALPSGASTEATLAAIKAKTDNLDVLLSTRTKPADTQTVAGTVTANVTPVTSGGLSTSRTISAASTNATSVKASAGQVYGWYLYNANAAVRFLKLYDKASAATVGTDVPKLTIPIPPGSAANVEFTNGVPFSLGIGLALTTGVADADTGAVAANEIVVNLMYK